MRYLPLVAYIGVIWLANLLIVMFGLVPIGFGLMAPAGVFAAGAALTFRDLTQESLGRRWTVAAIVIGALLSALVSPQFALASGVAFLLSEAADMAVYTPLAKRRWLAAVFASNVVGAVVDSALFLWLAFGDLTFLPGQLWGKFLMTLLAVAVLWVWRRQRQGAVAAVA